MGMLLWEIDNIIFLFIGGNALFISIVALLLVKPNISSISRKDLREIDETTYPCIWDVLRKSELSVLLIGFLNLSRLKIVNAYQWGPNKKAVILISDHLENILTDSEISAVVAHELGHIKHRHFEKTIITALISPLVLLNFYCSYILFNIREMLTPITEILLLIILGFLSLGVPIIVLPWASRRWETEADIYAANLVSPETLVSALQKMVSHDMVIRSISKRAELLLSHPHLDSRVKQVESSDVREDEITYTTKREQGD
jgi:Zn-dependent protease with chaperone function